jgi:hypothetical protein
VLLSISYAELSPTINVHQCFQKGLSCSVNIHSGAEGALRTPGIELGKRGTNRVAFLGVFSRALPVHPLHFELAPLDVAAVDMPLHSMPHSQPLSNHPIWHLSLHALQALSDFKRGNFGEDVFVLKSFDVSMKK